jgi:hypothetical protein
MKTFILAIMLATTAIAANAQGYPGPQGGFYVYGPDHEYHLLSRNHPVMTLRPYCNPQWNPDCNVLPPPGYPLQPLIPLAPPRTPPPPRARRIASVSMIQLFVMRKNRRRIVSAD